MRKQVLINCEENDIRVAILEDLSLVELFVEWLDSQRTIGNIYKGRVDSIVPGLKAVFVDIGTGKNAFLHFSDVLSHYELPMSGRPERERRKLPSEKAAEAAAAKEVDADVDEEFIEPAQSEDPIEPVNGHDPSKRKPKKKIPLRVGDEILVQVTKEQINDKGARITSYVSLPGRFLVMMPHSEKGGGVSRRVDDQEERRRLKRLLGAIHKDNSASFIVRTAGIGQPDDSIHQDVETLTRSWKEIEKRANKVKAPALLHNDHEILPRLVRDVFMDDIDEILIDDRDLLRELIKSCQELTPSLIDRIHFYSSPRNMFETFEVEKQFQKALRRKVWLKSGGQLVIDETEALTAIDVNSGKYVGSESQDKVILKTNLEACSAVSRQLRLRDLGGLVVIDFIDMRTREDQRKVLNELKRCLRADRAKYALTDFSEFGLVEMTRKRVRMSLAKSFYTPCPYCEGAGRILSDAQIWKQLKYDLIAELEKKPETTHVDVIVHSQLKTYIQENLVEAVTDLAHKYDVALKIIADSDCHKESFRFATKVISVEDKKIEAPPKRSVRKAGTA